MKRNIICFALKDKMLYNEVVFEKNSGQDKE
jgi:hypothetical protein